MVIITRHVFINISQTKPFSAVKLDVGYKKKKKKKSFPVMPKSPIVRKTVEKIGLGPSP